MHQAHTGLSLTARQRNATQRVPQALEEAGIGRPSTYAPTLKLLVDRQYVRKDGCANTNTTKQPFDVLCLALFVFLIRFLIRSGNCGAGGTSFRSRWGGS